MSISFQHIDAPVNVESWGRGAYRHTRRFLMTYCDCQNHYPSYSCHCQKPVHVFLPFVKTELYQRITSTCFYQNALCAHGFILTGEARDFLHISIPDRCVIHSITSFETSQHTSVTSVLIKVTHYLHCITLFETSQDMSVTSVLIKVTHYLYCITSFETSQHMSVTSVLIKVTHYHYCITSLRHHNTCLWPLSSSRSPTIFTVSPHWDMCPWSMPPPQSTFKRSIPEFLWTLLTNGRSINTFYTYLTDQIKMVDIDWSVSNTKSCHVTTLACWYLHRLVADVCPWLLWYLRWHQSSNPTQLASFYPV